MGYIYYCNIGLIPTGSTTSLESLKTQLEERLSKQGRPFHSLINGSHLRVKIEGYAFDIHYVDGAHVLEESGDMARYYQGDDPDAKASIARCAARFELSGDDDPNMDYFNDSVTILETWESMGIVHIFDPFGGKFLG